ncbi:PH domain-containing protein [Actinomadura flavalba]|uniref:PH domain-containing protein n=1 Tax=Actinomadura flavalba TaxID=1120938 RepID=UPI00037D34E6|nr:PH domain-containing protein [Actinomadura flavalba]
MTPQLTIRSTPARVVAWAWLAFAVLTLLDLAIGITGTAVHDRTSGVIALAVLFGCGLAYAIGLRPAILAGDEGVTVRNPLRTTHVPWRAVREIKGGAAVTVRFAAAEGERLTRAWVHQTSPRAQARAERRAAHDPSRAAVHAKGRTPAGYAAERLNEIGERHRPRTRSGAPDRAAEAARDAAVPVAGTVTWSWPTLIALIVPPVLILVLALA